MIHDATLKLLYPINYYGLISTIIVIPSGLIFIPLLFLYVKTPYLRNRAPLLVLACNLAYLLLAGGSAISYAYFPDSGCGFDLWGKYLKFSTYGFSLLMRAWVFAYKYYHAQTQVNPAKVDRVMQWCLQRKWLISTRFLVLVWVVCFILHALPPLLITLLGTAATKTPDIMTTQCPQVQWFADSFQWPLPTLYGAAVLALMFKLRTTNDAYHIRDELRAIAIIWVVGTVLWLVTDLLPAYLKVAYYVPSFVWLQLSYILSFGVSTIWVWTLCRQHGSWCLATVPSIEQEMDTSSFPALLRDGDFRKHFGEFLCLQFCVENLFFWEAVQHYRCLAPSEQVAEAKAIYEKYISAGALLEINIPVTVKKGLEAMMKEGITSDAMFDDAAAQTLRLMELDSYPRFVSRPAGATVRVRDENPTRSHLMH